jgi:hypothetical protein
MSIDVTNLGVRKVVGSYPFDRLSPEPRGGAPTRPDERPSGGCLRRGEG